MPDAMQIAGRRKRELMREAGGEIKTINECIIELIHPEGDGAALKTGWHLIDEKCHSLLLTPHLVSAQA
jgi:hypothetical protein